MSLETGELHGAEALVRWNHPTRGTLLPREFLAIAEENSEFILPISKWILREACRQYVEWQRSAPHLAPQYISINLSERQLMQNDLIPLLTRVIGAFSMRPDQLQVELTEAERSSVTAKTRERPLTVWRRPALAWPWMVWKGYSSLACLQQYPFSSVKLDRSFLSQPQTSQDMLAVAGSIIALAETLGD